MSTFRAAKPAPATLGGCHVALSHVGTALELRRRKITTIVGGPVGKLIDIVLYRVQPVELDDIALGDIPGVDCHARPPVNLTNGRRGRHEHQAK